MYIYIYMCSWVVEHLATPENTTELQGKPAACRGTVWVDVSIPRSYLAGAAFLKANCPEAW